MLGSKNTLVACLVILSLFMSSYAATAAMVEQYSEKQTSSAEAMAVDLIAARPLGFVAMVGGTLVFVVSWPFSALGGNSNEAWDTLVVAPAEYTFSRPLGNFDQQVVIRDN